MRMLTALLILGLVLLAFPVAGGATATPKFVELASVGGTEASALIFTTSVPVEDPAPAPAPDVDPNQDSDQNQGSAQNQGSGTGLTWWMWTLMVLGGLALLGAVAG